MKAGAMHIESHNEGTKHGFVPNVKAAADAADAAKATNAPNPREVTPGYDIAAAAKGDIFLHAGLTEFAVRRGGPTPPSPPLHRAKG